MIFPFFLTLSPFRLVDADERDDLFDIDEEELDFNDISSVTCMFWELPSTGFVGIEVLRDDVISQPLDNKAPWSGVDADGISNARDDDESTLSRWAEYDVD